MFRVSITTSNKAATFQESHSESISSSIESVILNLHAFLRDSTPLITATKSRSNKPSEDLLRPDSSSFNIIGLIEGELNGNKYVAMGFAQRVPESGRIVLIGRSDEGIQVEISIPLHEVDPVDFYDITSGEALIAAIGSDGQPSEMYISTEQEGIMQVTAYDEGEGLIKGRFKYDASDGKYAARFRKGIFSVRIK